MTKLDLMPLKKAHEKLTEYMKHNKTDQEQTAIVKTFEYCYELSWKMMKKLLENEGSTEATTPKFTFITAGRVGILEDVEIWFDFLEKRNKAAHTYEEEILEEIMQIMPKFKSELRTLIKVLDKRRNK